MKTIHFLFFHCSQPKACQNWYFTVHSSHPEPQKSKLRPLRAERCKGIYSNIYLKRLGEGLGSLQTLSNIRKYFLAAFNFSFCKCNLGHNFTC